MNRAEKKQRAKAEKRLRKEREMQSHGMTSRYARKKAWLNSHTKVEMWPFSVPALDTKGKPVVRTRVDATGHEVTEPVMVTEMREVNRQFWGFEVPEPKPWR